MSTIVAAAQGRPLHVHLSEQPAENAECRATYGVTPARLLAEQGVLTANTTAVHATHLTPDDITLLGRRHVTAGFCPTTERDLADGIGPARQLVDSGCGLALGTDQHAVIDMFEEARGVEMHERLSTNERGRFTTRELVAALTEAGHRALGWEGLGRIEAGATADLVAVRLDSVRTAGTLPDQIVTTATASDVHTVIADGRTIVSDGEHVLGNVATLLEHSIESLTKN
jgi:cytosine/adenosine deaminase-related metal-dependent hydrolase